MDEANTKENTGNPAVDTDLNEGNTSDSEALSRHERKKLKRQQFKESQQSMASTEKRKRIFKKISIYGIVLLVLAGLAYLIFLSSKTILPTIGDDPILGNPDAKITVIEFGDFQCPFTRSFNTGAFKDLMKEYDGKVKWVFKDMVTGKHLFSTEAALAANCANEQGKYWEYNDLIFTRKAADEQSLKSYAQQLLLDTQKFNECYDSRKYADEVKADYKEGKNAGVTITPTFYVNGVKMQGDLSAAVFKPYLDQMLAEG